MSWMGWAVIILIGLNAVFFGILVTIDLIRDWRFKHEQR